MTDITGGEVVVKTLLNNGFDTLFAIPGVQLDPIFAALHDARDNIRVIHARHEQGVALMAFGYAHALDQPAAMMVVPGPGFLNAATGILTAHACNTRLLCLIGQSERQFIGAGLGVLHELNDQVGIAAKFSKSSVRVESEQQISEMITAGIGQMFDHRPRPVSVELPSDIVRIEVSPETLPAVPQEQTTPELDMDTIHKIARTLADAQAPLIMAGGGCSHASTELLELTNLLDAPVGMAENGLGCLDSRHPNAFSQIGAHMFWEKADVVLALGTRLYAPVYNWGWDDQLEIIKVDIDAEELHRLPLAVSGIEADCKEFLAALCKVLPEYLKARMDRQQEFQAVRQQVEEKLSGLGYHRQILNAVRQGLGEDGILVMDVTQINHAAMDMYPVYAPRTYITSSYQGTLGFGFCTAMGAKLARPDSPVLCLTGDGGFMYACQELATAMQFSIPVIVLVINDGSYKNVETILNSFYGNRANATELRNPDFLKLADSFGAEGRRVHTPQELEPTIKELLALNKPAVIDFQPEALETTFWLRFLPQVRERIPENPYSLVKKQS